MRGRWWAALWILLACRDYGPELVDVPGEWRTWFAEVEACSGLRGDFDRITWAIHEEPERRDDGLVTLAHIDLPDHIWIARAYQNERVVKHELLHFLLQRGGHPTPPFGTCANVIGG
jgi:hypothetical protein